jgi:hypothetical protein
MLFSRFKDFTVLGIGAMPQTHSRINSNEIATGITIRKINEA